MHQHDVFKRGIPNFPVRYGVVLDFGLAKKTKSGYENFGTLKDDPVFVCRAAGVDATKAYLNKV